jgi:hypothetical protein
MSSPAPGLGPGQHRLSKEDFEHLVKHHIIAYRDDKKRVEVYISTIDEHSGPCPIAIHGVYLCTRPPCPKLPTYDSENDQVGAKGADSKEHTKQ